MSQRLEDIEDIRQLKYRYCRCIDTANIDELRELFTEDASVLYIGGSYRFEAQGRDKILEAIAYGFHAEAAARHNVHHPEIEIISETEARGTWYLSDIFYDMRNRIITDGTALYKDQYVKTGAGWRIKRADYSRIYEIVTPMEETPNFTARYLADHGKQLPPE